MNSRLGRPGRKILPALIILGLLFSSFLILLTVQPATAQSPTIPPGIVAYVPITITNQQPLPTPAPFQQLVRVNSAAYSSYEASNLQNVLFFYASGGIVPSWLESGNSNTATGTVYWLSISGGIRAASSITFYMGFASPPTNALNGQTTGEAPQLSPTYAQFDNGASIFPTFYESFAGVRLPHDFNRVTHFDNPRSASSTSSDSNGLFLQTTGGLSCLGCGSFIHVFSTGTFNPVGSVFDAYLSSTTPQTLPSTNQYGVAGLSLNPTAPCGGSNCGDFWGFNNAVQEYEGYTNTGAYYNPRSTSGGFAYDYRQGLPFSGNQSTANMVGVYSLDWQTATAFTTEYNYASQLTMSQNIPSLGAAYVSLDFYASALSSAQAEFQWVRQRAYPPGGTMPTVSLDSLVAATTSVSCSPSVGAAGSPVTCIATVMGNSPTGTITWSSNGVGTFTPSYSYCFLSSGQCSVLFTPTSSTTSPVTITATYGGDASNAPGLPGSFSFAVAKSSATTSVSCSPSPVSLGASSMCTATVTGSAPTGTIMWASSGVANFSPAPICSLSGGTCSVYYTPSSSGSITITATYQGDVANGGSFGAFALSATQLTTSTATTSLGTGSTSTMSSASSATSTSSSSSSGSSGIPEFPIQLGFSLLATIAIVTSYVLARHGLQIGKQTPI
jgi:hypothetical protein